MQSTASIFLPRFASKTSENRRKTCSSFPLRVSNEFKRAYDWFWTCKFRLKRTYDSLKIQFNPRHGSWPARTYAPRTLTACEVFSWICSRSRPARAQGHVSPMHPGRDEADPKGPLARPEKLPKGMEQDDTTIRRINTEKNQQRNYDSRFAKNWAVALFPAIVLIVLIKLRIVMFVFDPCHQSNTFCKHYSILSGI